MKKTAFVILSLLVFSVACIASGPMVPFTQVLYLGPPTGTYYYQGNHATLATNPCTGVISFKAHLYGELIVGTEENLLGFLETEDNNWVGYCEGTATNMNPTIDLQGTFTVDVGDTAPEMYIQKPYYVPVPPYDVTAFASNSYYRITILDDVEPD